MLLKVIVAVALLVPAPLFAANQQAPSYGISVVPSRMAAVDGSGVTHQFAATLGYKVFQDSASAAAVLMTDEFGNAPVCGVVHMVCVDGASTSVTAVDASAAAGIVITSANAVIPLLTPASAATTCLTVDAQFNKGLVIVNGAATGASYIYWRPCTRGQN